MRGGWVNVYAERHEDILSAIQREKNIKDWPRAWKIRLICGQNPDCEDLCEPFLQWNQHSAW